MSATATSLSETKITPASSLSSDASLVRQALLDRGLETPMIENGLSRDDKYRRILASMTDVVTTLGLDLRDDSLQETPHRIAKMYVDELFEGLDYSNFPKISVIDNKMRLEEMIKVSDINVLSTCEHHFVTIDGNSRVAYIPRDKIIGLSKINRIVNFFAQRPQVQERLTQQVRVALQTLLGTDDVAVVIDATHYCVKARGVMDSNSKTQTTSLGGRFKEDRQTRIEFLA
jgi:GTP cyclohydrolase I